LHPTALPGPYGIGDLGPQAYAWVDALIRAGQTYWQVLPLNPTGFGDSPYQGLSAIAGNPNLVSPEALAGDGLLDPADLTERRFPPGAIDYGRTIEFKRNLLARAWARFRAGTAPALRQPFEEFAARQGFWLDDFALFMALKEAHKGAAWSDWARELVLRQPMALARARQALRETVGFHQFAQFLFFRQWQALRAYASERGVRIIGDVPIFVASDSADVWGNPELFQLDARRRPMVVAGVPPDYFSRTGQLWGNPLYDWRALKERDYAWWVARLRAILELVDVVRIDHFRGLVAYWEVPADQPTAQFGRWAPGPGADFCDAVARQLGFLPVLAEDLGLITPDVVALREQYRLPGMRVLQFAFGAGNDNLYLPHNYTALSVAYTGTHDNDTSRGWYASASDQARDHFRRYAGRDGSDVAWDLIRLAWASVSDCAIAPLQDVLDLGSEARMNAPGRAGGNWTWRFREGMLTDFVLERLRALTELYQR
jgi:4-alpha-glucanotransferase